MPPEPIHRKPLRGRRSYCGQLGKQDNCQVAVSLSIANTHASLPIAYRLYLPEAWANDPIRRSEAGVPEAVRFETKPQIALGQIRAALAAGIPPAVVLTDAGYGVDTDFRDGLTGLHLLYAVGAPSSTSVWTPGTAPLPPKRWRGFGRPPSLIRRDPAHKPVSIKQLAMELPKRAWRRITWREGTNTPLVSRFAAVRVRPAHRDYNRTSPRPEEWCLIEWPKGEAMPTKYWLSTLPEDTRLLRSGRFGQAALADRTRLSGAEAGTRPFDDAQHADLPAVEQLIRQDVHRPTVIGGRSHDAILPPLCRHLPLRGFPGRARIALGD